MGKTLFKSLIASLLCLLSLSCTLLTDNYGSINLILPEINSQNINNTKTRSRESIFIKTSIEHNFQVTLTNKMGKVVKKCSLPPKQEVVLENIPVGNYTLSLNYEDNSFIVHGQENIIVKSGFNAPVDIDITWIRKYPNIDNNENTNKPETPNKGEEDNTQPLPPEENNGNGENTLPPLPDNGGGEEKPSLPENGGDTHPSVPDSKPGEGDNNPSPSDPITPPEETIEYVTYYVDGQKGNDWGNDGLTSNKPLKTVSMAASKIKQDENVIIEVSGTVTETKLIEFTKSSNVILRGANNSSSKIVRRSGSDFIVVGTANGKDKGNTSISVRPNVTIENITIDANTKDRAILVYYGSLHLGDNVVIQGKAKASVQGHVGANANIFLGGSCKLTGKINLLANGFITIEKPLTLPLVATLELFKKDGITPNYDTASFQFVRAMDGVNLSEEVVKLQLGNNNFVLASDGTVTKK